MHQFLLRWKDFEKTDKVITFGPYTPIPNLNEIHSVISKMKHVDGQKRLPYYVFIFALSATESCSDGLFLVALLEERIFLNTRSLRDEKQCWHLKVYFPYRDRVSVTSVRSLTTSVLLNTAGRQTKAQGSCFALLSFCYTIQPKLEAYLVGKCHLTENVLISCLSDTSLGCYDYN